MTRVRLLTSIAGMGFSHQAGDIVELPRADAARLIATGQAEAAPVEKPQREKR